MNNLNQLIPVLLIVLTCITSYIGFNNSATFQRYQFNVIGVRYHKQYRRLITSAFLHADWWHLFFNMFTLYFFSQVISYVYGVLGFLLLYFGSVLAGNVFSLWLYKNRPSYAAIGASGGVSGILFAAIALMPQQTIYLYFIPVTSWIFATLYFAYSAWSMVHPRPNDNTGHASHLGGAVLGMIFVAVLTPMYFMRNIVFIGIMSLPLLYLAYEILFNKKAR
ncbi:rhomboid family intramembrane serine protease [Wielerella bovis]|uniref:rhomboid family intramembrane serine protease n=1 Tax=Wielerella bovis TaxID=2917790 RepID=UPI002019C1FB|nr:rhomboid family intramembrane serine protease [Wielerella bovis]MCG7657977.1 rhomboid family intramembrane serine protease [Wielerella bovis]MCG7660199.1 rhomboid family intramembrane serine protease [Wielerella bovis]ULJ62416.1 rhomboid family intramembrane serine protease [Wielerella bovis]ULJ69135.1 rhomboid family intramembrane serine protease [Wielerella bovis]